MSTTRVNWADPESVVEYQVGWSRLVAGRRPFDEEAMRAFVRRDVGRARDSASLQNHGLLTGDEGPRRSIASITAATLVVHGTEDPMFPLAHGEALAGGIPGARLLALDGAGHGLDRADRELVARAILEHASAASPC